MASHDTPVLTIWPWSDSVWGLGSRWAEQRAGRQPSLNCVNSERAAAAAAAAHISFSNRVALHLPFNFLFPEVVWEALVVCESLSRVGLKTHSVVLKGANYAVTIVSWLFCFVLFNSKQRVTCVK